MKGYTEISKEQFYRYGGFSNPKLCRVTRDRAWAYFREDRA